MRKMLYTIYVCILNINICVHINLTKIHRPSPPPPPPKIKHTHTHRSRLPSGDAECLADVAALRAQALADKEVSSCQPVGRPLLVLMCGSGLSCMRP